MAIHPVILCGGSGTRLWPLSRAMFPKQFIRFNGAMNASFLQAAICRLPQGQGFERPTLVCNNDHRFLVAEEIASTGVSARRIILEPMARNTAPAIAAAARNVIAEDGDAVLVVMPSDHVIRDEAGFLSAVRQAADVARRGALVLFGITPDLAHTGYGYIRRGKPLAGLNGSGALAAEVEAFVEKPDVATAQKYVEDGNYFWNSGIFVLHAQTFLSELDRHEPAIAKACQVAHAKAVEDLDFLRLDKTAFAQAPAISVDYAVMERTKAAAMLPISVGWSDVGSWSSLWEIGKQDANGNVTQGATILEDTHNTYVHAERAIVSTLGVDNLVIVETPDAILVADKDRTQDVGKLVARLKEKNRPEHAQHIRNHRPWGHFEALAIGPRFQVKRLHVKPGGKLSMQMHHHRSEHWIVVQGTAHVTIGEIEKLVRENESVYIFATQWHRLENPGKVPLEIIEIQIGSYLGEDDIIRSDDIYHRAPDETR
jgi:mannose-1-phosphate guanylyltransferase/mannose-6-phosphate isomerase